jgi:hypothetical protein
MIAELNSIVYKKAAKGKETKDFTNNYKETRVLVGRQHKCSAVNSRPPRVDLGVQPDKESAE